MNFTTSLYFALLFSCCALFLRAEPAVAQLQTSTTSSTNQALLLSPPQGELPILVKAKFGLRDITKIDDEEETFQFTGVLRLSWHDPRQSFDPKVEGVNEKVFSGGFQFNEISPAWYPEVALANAAGFYEQYGLVLRVKPDGTSTLTSVIDALAEVDLNMRRYPFDSQSLEAVFEIVGFNADEVKFSIDDAKDEENWRNVKVSQWHIHDINVLERSSNELEFLKSGVGSTFSVVFELQRKSLFVVRLVVVPLALIVMLSWSVFWMERSSLGDRINVSFVGILTAVAYQIVVGDLLPHISYFTLMNAFVNLSLAVMCATVVVNLVVGEYDKSGNLTVGDRIDSQCRWMFPLIYAGVLSLFLVIVFLFF